MKHIVTLVVMLVIAFGMRQFFRDRADKKLQSVEVLAEAAAAVNAVAPRIVAPDVELMGADAKEATFIYNYRFLKYEGGTVNVTAFKDQALVGICADTIARRQILAHGITLMVNIHDKYRQKLTTLAVLPNSC